MPEKKYYQFKVQSHADVDLVRICNEAPADQDAIVVPDPTGNEAIVFLCNSFLAKNKGKVLGFNVSPVWGYDMIDFGDTGKWDTFEDFKADIIEKEEIGTFVQNYLQVKRNQANSVNIERNPRKRLKVKVHYV